MGTVANPKSVGGYLRWAVVGAVLVASPFVLAQGGHDHGKKDGGEEKQSAGHGKGGMKHGMMGQEHGPGGEMPMCHGHEGMPPHFCEPVYKVASSVRGVAVDEVASAGDRALMVTLKEINVMTPGVGQKLVIIAGSGDLAGAAVVDAAWKGSKSVHVNLIGNDSIYDHKHVHVHVFPLTTD